MKPYHIIIMIIIASIVEGKEVCCCPVGLGPVVFSRKGQTTEK